MSKNIFMYDKFLDTLHQLRQLQFCLRKFVIEFKNSIGYSLVSSALYVTSEYALLKIIASPGTLSSTAWLICNASSLVAVKMALEEKSTLLSRI